MWNHDKTTNAILLGFQNYYFLWSTPSTRKSIVVEASTTCVIKVHLSCTRFSQSSLLLSSAELRTAFARPQLNLNDNAVLHRRRKDLTRTAATGPGRGEIRRAGRWGATPHLMAWHLVCFDSVRATSHRMARARARAWRSNSWIASKAALSQG